jgi:type IV secretory pathway TrbD component
VNFGWFAAGFGLGCLSLAIFLRIAHALGDPLYGVCYPR